MSRRVVLVVLDESGRVLGALPPYEVPQPWWMEVADVVAGAQASFGLEVTVLRLLQADRPRHPGGTVHYAVQLSPPTYGPSHPAYGLLTPVDDQVRVLAEGDHPRRAAYARPGGPQATLAWGIAALGRESVVAVVQQRTWNLSAIWRLDTANARYWLKEVPDFFQHEGTALRWLLAAGYGDRVPPLVADAGPRLLMVDCPGEGLYDADAATRRVSNRGSRHDHRAGRLPRPRPARSCADVARFTFNSGDRSRRGAAGRRRSRARRAGPPAPSRPPPAGGALAMSIDAL